MKAVTWGVRQYPHAILLDYEMFQGTRGPVFYAFVDEKTGERYYGAKADIEFLIELMQLRLKWLKDDEGPNAVVGEVPSADTQGGNPPVGQQDTPAPPSSPQCAWCSVCGRVILHRRNVGETCKEDYGNGPCEGEIVPKEPDELRTEGTK